MIYLILLLTLVYSKTNVFVVPHSHNDAGWLETISDYYKYSVKHTLNNIILQLEKRPSFKFCWSEVIYLSMWLEEYPERKKTLKDLISNGKFEIVGGGWVQNDEALPDFESVLRQHEVGFDYIQKELNVSQVKIGWQLDPFGHSSLTAALFEKMGIESLFFARVDLRVKKFLEFTQNMEFVWKGEGFGSEKGIFTHLLGNHYIFPKFADNDNYGRCYNSLPVLPEELKVCTKDLELFVNSQKNYYKTNNILILIGSDFSYTQEFFTFDYLDFWEQLMNSTTAFNIKFATPSEYLSSIKSSKSAFSLFEGDLLPLISEGSGRTTPDYKKSWTGFYSTKPFLKKLIYDVQKLARIAEFFSTKVLNQEFFAKDLSATMHHDAITGTCKFHVYLDYIRILKSEKIRINKVLGEAFTQYLRPSFTGALVKQYKIVYLVNPVNWPVKKTVNFIVNWKNSELSDSSGKKIRTQTVPYKKEFKLFFVEELKGFEVKVLFIEESSEEGDQDFYQSNEENLDNGLVSVGMKGGMIYSVTKNGVTYVLNSKLVVYDTANGGPYTFFPINEAMRLEAEFEFKVYRGKIVNLAQTLFFYANSVFTQQVFLDSHSSCIYFTFDVYAHKNSEIFLRFEHSHEGLGWFNLFNSGNLMRKFFQYEESDSKGLNYFPINGAALIDFGKEFLHIFPGFPLGAGMPDKDHFELNLHRHPAYDDGLGLDGYVPDDLSVEHSWILKFQELSPNTLWKSYIEAKTYPTCFFMQDHNEVTESHEKGAFFTIPAHFLPIKQLMPEDNCNYFSSFLLRNGKKVLQVMNICEESKELKGFTVVEERMAAGLKKSYNSDWLVNSKLEFSLGNNSGFNVLKYPRSVSVNGIKPFHLKTFVVVSKYLQINHTTSVNISEISLFVCLFFSCSAALVCLFSYPRLFHK